MATFTYTVTGMTCQNCADKIETALAPLVDTVAVSVETKTVVLNGGQAGDMTALNTALALVGGYRLEAAAAAAAPAATAAQPHRLVRGFHTYKPLLLVVGLALGVALLLAARAPRFLGTPNAMTVMNDFMGMFFLLFGFFKLLNLRGFVEAYRRYDIIAKQLPFWAWVYPFVELLLGAAYLTRTAPELTNALTLVIMLVGLAGVWPVVRKRQKIQCACLGTVFNLPMSTVTIVENGGMAAMALIMLLSASV